MNFVNMSLRKQQISKRLVLKAIHPNSYFYLNLDAHISVILLTSC